MSSTTALRVLILQVVANDLPSGTLKATVERAGGGEPIQTKNIEPGHVHAFQLRPVGVDLFLEHDGVRKRVPIERTSHLILASKIFPPEDSD